MLDDRGDARTCRDGPACSAIGKVHFRGRGSGVEFDQPIAWIMPVPRATG